MTADNEGISLLKKREIEIGIPAPIVRAFAAEIGQERAFSIALRAIREAAAAQGAEVSTAAGKGLESLKSCIAAWNEDGALVSNVVRDTDDEFRFDVTRCAFAELYREMGCEEIGAILSCARDEAFLEGFDDSLELVREKTIMAGDGVCDFCYRKRAKNEQR